MEYSLVFEGGSLHKNVLLFYITAFIAAVLLHGTLQVSFDSHSVHWWFSFLFAFWVAEGLFPGDLEPSAESLDKLEVDSWTKQPRVHNHSNDIMFFPHYWQTMSPFYFFMIKCTSVEKVSRDENVRLDGD